jgi:RNA polymerase sigma factor (sigma-70 family)
MIDLGSEPSRSTRGVGRRGPASLTSEDELRLTQQIDGAEAAMARALVRAPRALAELGRLAQSVSTGGARSRDLVRVAEQGARGAPATRREVVAVLERASRLAARAATTEELCELARDVAELRLRPGVLDRVAATMDDDDADARAAFVRARAALRKAKSEWTAATTYLVHAIARRYRRPGVEATDLVQDGTIGLIRAVEKFDPTLGHPFRVYAAWWIRQHIFRALASYGRTIRVPLPMVEASHRVARARRMFEGIHGGEPDEAQLAEASGMDVATVAAVAAIREDAVSLYGRLGEEETNVLDRLTDRSADLPDEQLERARLNERIRALFEALPARDQAVLRLRLGLDGEAEHTQLEVATTLGISRDRARRIEEQALAKLRSWCARGGLRAHEAA